MHRIWDKTDEELRRIRTYHEQQLARRTCKDRLRRHRTSIAVIDRELERRGAARQEPAHGA